jgi:hypothetical protein
MNLKLNLITLICLFILSAGSIKAQTTEPSFTPGQLKAAERCLIATGIDKQFGDIINKTISTGSTQIPEEHRASFVKVMKTFMGQYFTWDVLKDRIAKLYATEFTESELNQLTAFYNTPLGKKVGEKLPMLMQKGMLLGQQAVEEHRPELEQMMKEAFQNDVAPAKQ